LGEPAADAKMVKRQVSFSALIDWLACRFQL
jgi:hypothetical protein